LQWSGQFDERSFGTMGTSTAHRSPATPEWERVRELYKQPNPVPGEVVGRIVAALSPETRQQMRGPSVAYDLDALLSGSYQVATQGLSEVLAGAQAFAAAPVVSLAALLRDQAQQRIIAAQVSSRFGELALDALSNTVMDVAAGGRGLLQAQPAQVEANFGRYFTEQTSRHLASGSWVTTLTRSSATLWLVILMILWERRRFPRSATVPDCLTRWPSIAAIPRRR